MLVLLVTVTAVAGTEPKVTTVVPARCAPVMVTVVPPPGGPWVGLREVICCARATGGDGSDGPALLMATTVKV